MPEGTILEVTVLQEDSQLLVTISEMGQERRKNSPTVAKTDNTILKSLSSAQMTNTPENITPVLLIKEQTEGISSNAVLKPNARGTRLQMHSVYLIVIFFSKCLPSCREFKTECY